MKDNRLNKGLNALRELFALIFCAGIGTTSWALREEGYRIAGAIDNWEFAHRIYGLNFPGTPFIERSLRALSPERIRTEFNLRPEDDIDLIQISNPCTGVSRIGKREYFCAVNDLFFVCTKLAFALNPKVVMYENVTGLAYPESAVLFGMFMEFLEREAKNYHIEAKTLNSYLYGDPQARERVFIQCVRKDCGRPAWPEPLPEEQRKIIGDVLEDVEYLANRQFGNHLYHRYEPAPTVVANNDMTVHDGEKERRITPRECARLMGLPDEFILEGSNDDQIKGIGNGVCVSVMRKIAATLREKVFDQPTSLEDNS